jgi:hypothetical protein
MAWPADFLDLIGTYTRDYVPSTIIDGMRGSHTLGIFFRLDSTPPLQIWTGVNDVPAGFDSIDSGGSVYLGGGRLLNVGSLEVLVNGQADDIEIGISGVDPKAAQRVIDEMPDIRGKDVHLGITVLDRYYQPVAPIAALWIGTASHPTESMLPVSGQEQRTVTLSLAVISGNTTRSRPALSMWTAAHQKAEFPTDLFCDGTPRLARGVAPAWPNY